jgi:hypothetical protein
MDASIDEPKFNPADEDVQPALPNAAPIPEKQPDPSDSGADAIGKVVEYGADAAIGIARGAENAVRGVRTNARALADVTGLSTLVGDKETNAEPLTHGTAEPTTLAGNITSSLTEAALSWVAGGKIAKAAGIAIQGTTAGGAAAQTALGSLITTDPHHERLSNVLMQYPVIGPAFSLLATNPEDSVVIAKAKSVIEESFTAGAATKIFNALHLAALKVYGATTNSVTKAEKLVVEDLAADAGTAGPRTIPDYTGPNARPSLMQEAEARLAKLNPVENKQALKDATQKVLGEKYGDTGAAFRAMKPEEMKKILSESKMQLGYNPEGISAQLIGKEGTAIYHEGNGMIVRAGEHQSSGRFGEVHVKEASDPMKATYMIGGKEHTFEEAKVAILGPAKQPTSIRTPTGEPIVTLTAAQSKKFEALQDRLVIRDATSGVPRPLQGDAASAAKEGVPLRPKFNDSPNAVLQGLADLGNLTKAQLGAKVVSEESTRATASMMGMKPEELVANLKAANAGLEDIDAIALGARQFLQQQGAEMFSLAKKALGGDEAARAAHIELSSSVAGVQAEFAEMTTKLGRGLHSYSYNVGPFDPKKFAAKLADPKEAERWERLVEASGGDADKLAHLITMQNLTWFQKAVGVHNEYWTGLGLLSRLATQTVNLTSTAIQGLMQPASMIVGGIEQGITGNGFEAAKMGVGIYAGMRTAIFDSLHMAWQAAKTEKAILSQAGTMEQKTQFISALTFNMNPDTFHGKFIDLMGEVTRASFRGLTAGDEFFKQLSYRAYVSSQAGIEAAGHVKAGIMSRDQVAGFIASKLQQSLDDQGRGIIPEALLYAEKAAFVQDLKIPTLGGYPSIGELSARAASHPVIRGVILPFVKTPTNVTRTTFEYTPIIGQFRRQFYSDVSEGGIKQAMAVGKLTIGAGFYVGAGMLALEGRITGAPPPKGVAVPPGWKPYSVKFTGMGKDGGDLYISYQRLQPFGDILGLTVDFAKSSGMLDADTRDGLAHSMSLAVAKFLDGSAGEKYNMLAHGAVSASAAFGKSLISKSYFRNMTEFFSTFSGYNNEDKVVRWFQNYAASHVPGVLSQFNSDDTVREVRSTLDAIMARIPGLSQSLPASRDYFGAINDVKIGYPYSIIQPLATSSTKVDPVYSELQRLSASRVQAKFNEPDHAYSIGGKMQDLKTVTNAEGVTAYDRMLELLQTVRPPGETENFHDRVKSVMEGSRYQLGHESDILDGAPDVPGLRLKLVKVEEQKYRQAALDQVKNEFAGPLGIKSALMDKVDTQVGRKKIAAGIYDKIIEFSK